MADNKVPITGKLAIDGKEGVVSFEVPNWSRETSLDALNKKVLTMSKKFNKGGAVGLLLKEVAGGIANVEKAVLGTKKQQKKDNTADSNSQKKTEQHQNKTQQASEALLGATLGNQQALKELANLSRKSGGSGDGGSGMLGNLAGKAGPFAVFGNTLMKAAKGIAGFILAIGKAAAALATMITSVLMKTFNYLNDSLTNGTAGLVGAYTDSSTNIATQASLAGLSMKDFTDALTETSEEIMVLGAEGYKDLRNATRDVSGGLYDMGFRNEEITKLLGREISIRARMGMQLNMEGTNLAGNVVEVGKSLRHVSKAAGINAETLYNSSKVSDETNTLIAARARDLGDNGISELQTSIRKLSMKMVGLSPTYAHEITSPLINAIVTGAVGLDEGFTELVIAMPGLTDAMNLAQQDITNSGKITDSTINEIMHSLADTTDEEFDRARQLALMTRSQSAIQAVNFASEVRARRALISDLTTDGDKARNIATISAQADTFFDMMKAPFENSIMQFTMGILGVSSDKGAINFGDVITQFSEIAMKFVHNLPLIGNLFQEGGFFKDFNELVKAYFKQDATGAEREDARAKLNDLVTNTIDEISTSISDQLQAGNLGTMIASFFKDLIDDLRISIFETTGMMAEGAAMAYLRSGQTNKVIDMQERGLFGMGDSDAVSGIVESMYYDNRDNAADQFGMKTDDFFDLIDASTRTTNRIKEKYGLSDDDVTFARMAAEEVQNELNAFWAKHGIDNQNGGLFGTNMSSSQFEALVNDGDQDAIKALTVYAQNQKTIDGAMSSFSGTSFDGIDISGSSRVINNAMNKINKDVTGGINNIMSQSFLRDSIATLQESGVIKTEDGLDRYEKNAISSSVEQMMKDYLKDNKVTADEQKEVMAQLIGAMDKLVVQIKGQQDNPNT